MTVASCTVTREGENLNALKVYAIKMRRASFDEDNEANF